MIEKKMGSIIIKCDECGHVNIINNVPIDGGRYFFAQCLNLNPDCQVVYLFDLKTMKSRGISKERAQELHSEMVQSGIEMKYFTGWDGN